MGQTPLLQGELGRRHEVELTMARLSGSEIRRLLELREMIKVESFRLPSARQRELLELLERSRPWIGTAPPLPEMSRGEMVRAIRWRLGTVSLPTAEAAAGLVRRARRRRLRHA